MDDLSPWDWVSSFRLHEAACLIVGVRPLSKRIPDREELPSQAVPIVHKLSSAYVDWLVRREKPRPDSPKEFMLEPPMRLDGSPPPLPKPIKNILGAFVDRAEIHRWLGAIGMSSKYSFGPRAVVDRDSGHASESSAAPPDTRYAKKLSPDDDREIARLYDRGHGRSVSKLATDYKVSRPTIDKALKRAGVKGKS